MILEVKEAFKCENLGSINMKYKAQPLTVYNMIELRLKLNLKP